MGIDNRQHYVAIKKMKNGFRGKGSWWTICRTVILQICCKYVCTYGHTCDEQNPKKLGPGDWCGLVTSPGFLGGLRGLASTGQ